jgi:rhodanese-related sulfurtransferase
MQTVLKPHATNILYDGLLKILIPAGAPLIDVNELREMEDYILLDTREDDEFQVSHIKNALPVGYKNFDTQKIGCFKKNKIIVAYCSVGVRSAKIAHQLFHEGFENTYNLYGGIFEWVNRGNKIYNDEGVTNNLHVYSKIWGIWAHGCNTVT